MPFDKHGWVETGTEIASIVLKQGKPSLECDDGLPNLDRVLRFEVQQGC